MAKSIKSQVFRFGLGQQPVPWIVLNVRVGDIDEMFYIEPFDYKTGEGWQREQSRSHQRDLNAVMLADEYTPAGMIGGVTRALAAGMRFYEAGGVEMVEIPAVPGERFALIDGGHRRNAIQMEIARAEEAGDAERLGVIRGQDVTIQVLLDPDRLQAHFANLQKGRPVDKNLMRSIDEANDQIPADKVDANLFANKVALALNGKKSSHLHEQVGFGSSQGNVSYNSIASYKSSDLATSIFGGALIAREFGLKEKWLTDTYVEAWQSLLVHGEKDEGSDTPNMMRQGRSLRPTIYSGNRGPSAFIVAIGNLLAYRKAVMGYVQTPVEEQRRIAKIADEMFDVDASRIGWSGADKRNLLSHYAKRYFADMILKKGDDPSDTTRVAGIAGVPLPLVQILSPSTFAIPRPLIQALRKGVAPEPEEASDLGGFDDLPVTTGTPAGRPKAKMRRLAKGSAV